MAGIGGERTRFIHQLWFFGFLPSLSAARPRVQHTVPFRNPEQLSLVGQTRREWQPSIDAQVTVQSVCQCTESLPCRER